MRSEIILAATVISFLSLSSPHGAASLLLRCNVTGATVTVDGGRDDGLTDRNGLVSFSGLSAGSHTVHLSHDEYAPDSVVVQIDRKLTRIVEVNLRPLDRSSPRIVLSPIEAVFGQDSVTYDDSLQIDGIATDNRDIASVTVNGKAARLVNPGRAGNSAVGRRVAFSAVLPLQKGENRIVVEAVDSDSNKCTVNMLIKRRDLLESLGMNCRALLIGVDEYPHWKDLDSSILDIRQLGTVLEDSYRFRVNRIYNPDKQTLLDAISSYRDTLFSDNDEMLVVLSGRSHCDCEGNGGFFVARDGLPPKAGMGVDDAQKYIFYPDLLINSLDALSCKHILVVLDACFAGMFPKHDCDTTDMRTKYLLEHASNKLKPRSRLLINTGCRWRESDLDRILPRIQECLLRFDRRKKIMTIEDLKEDLSQSLPGCSLIQFGTNEPGSSFLFFAR